MIKASKQCTEASEFDFRDATLDLLSEVFSKRIHSIFEESITPIPNILRSTLPSLTWFSDKSISSFKWNNWSDFDRLKTRQGNSNHVPMMRQKWSQCFVYSKFHASSLANPTLTPPQKTFATRSSALQPNQLIRWRLFSPVSPTCELCSVRKSHLLEMKY